jgi:hypothetical protein
MGQKKDWKQRVLVSKKRRKKREKKTKEIKEYCVQHTTKGFGQQQVSFGEINVHLSTSYLLFLSLCTFSFIFSNLDLCSWIIWFFITTFQCITLTYCPTKLHLKSTVSCCTVVAVTITLPLQIAARFYLFSGRERTCFVSGEGVIPHIFYPITFSLCY